MNTSADFIPLVQKNFERILRERELKKVQETQTLVLKGIVYANSSKAFDFSLDVRDGYVDCLYGPASILDADGLPRWPDSESMISMNKLLRDEGVHIPVGMTELYNNGRLEEVIKLLVQGLADHADVVFAVNP